MIKGEDSPVSGAFMAIITLAGPVCIGRIVTILTFFNQFLVGKFSIFPTSCAMAVRALSAVMPTGRGMAGIAVGKTSVIEGIGHPTAGRVAPLANTAIMVGGCLLRMTIQAGGFARVIQQNMRPGSSGMAFATGVAIVPWRGVFPMAGNALVNGVTHVAEYGRFPGVFFMAVAALSGIVLAFRHVAGLAVPESNVDEIIGQPTAGVAVTGIAGTNVVIRRPRVAGHTICKILVVKKISVPILGIYVTTFARQVGVMLFGLFFTVAG